MFRSLVILHQLFNDRRINPGASCLPGPALLAPSSWSLPSLISGCDPHTNFKTPSRTGQAALPHPALQLVVGLHRRLANASIVRYKVRPMVVSRYRGGQQTLTKALKASSCVADSPDLVRRTFVVFLIFLALFIFSTFLP